LTMRSLAERIKSIGSASDAGAVALVQELLSFAVDGGASDVHIEPGEDAVAVLMRIDGVLRHMADLDKSLAAYVVGRVKVLADLLTYRTDIPQEGRITFTQHEQEVAIRISVFPTASGEKIVARIFDPGQRLKNLSELGLAAHDLAKLTDSLQGGDGLILFTGPAGSGKTTTIYACLSELLHVTGGRRSIVTVEDPIEFRLPGITQTEVNSRVGLTFASSLSHLLRQDPEVLMVGEIRDAETAKIAVEAALVGHLLLSTMHCGDGAGAFTRLLDMGIEPYLVTSSVRLVAAQRLLRRLCENCRRISDTDSGIKAVRKHYEAPGCEQCGGSGFRGRLPVSETVAMNEALRAAVLSRGDTEQLRKVTRENAEGPTLAASALEKVRNGETSVLEITRVFGRIQ